jgi:hypothetical protein
LWRHINHKRGGTALQRAVIWDMKLAENCVEIAESIKNKWLNFIAPKEYYTYAPGIGLVQRQDMKLVSYGYIK